MKTYHYGVRAKSPHLLTRVTGLVVMEIYATNPNGDPNADGVPRIMPDLRGLISNGSFKRKYRDLIADGHPAATAFLEDMGLKVGDNLIAMKKMEETNDQVGKQAAMLNQARKDGHFSHHDVRLFGGFFAPAKQVKTKGKNGNADAEKPKTEKPTQDPFNQKGPLVVGNGVSIAPIEIVNMGITRSIGMSMNERTGEDKAGGMGNVSFVQFGIYAFPLYFSPTNALVKQSMMTANDLELFRRLVPYVGDNRSNSRTSADVSHVYWYEHELAYGDIADQQILDAFTPKLIEGRDGQKKEDYVFFDPSSDEAKKVFSKNIEFAMDFRR